MGWRDDLGKGKYKTGARKKKSKAPSVIITLVVLAIIVYLLARYDVITLPRQSESQAEQSQSGGPGVVAQPMPSVEPTPTPSSASGGDLPGDGAEAATPGVATEQPADAPDTGNPVPRIAASARESVVGIAAEDGSGTGFVISEGGYIVTNSHVVENSRYFMATDYAGNEYAAELVGYDADADIAVLKAEDFHLKPIAIGDSDTVQIGELVVAIGNPLGQTLSNSVTVGYLSGVDRVLNKPDSEELFRDDLLQTDAAINHGNSGGPLLNSGGEVIGVNVMKVSDSTAEGLGFAIPINSAMETAAALIEDGGEQRLREEGNEE